MSMFDWGERFQGGEVFGARAFGKSGGCEGVVEGWIGPEVSNQGDHAR